MVKVLQVLDVIGQGSGVSAVVTNYCFHMDPKHVHCDFLLFCPAEGELEKKLKERGAKIYVTGYPGASVFLSYQRRVKQFFLQHAAEYDMIHVHIPVAAFFLLRKAKKYGIACRILHSHNARGADGFLKKIRNYLLNKWGVCYANEYFACSKRAGIYLYGDRKMRKSKKPAVQIVPNAVDLSKYWYNEERRQETREKLQLGEVLVLGHVGRFVEQKNHVRLLEIFCEAKKREPDAKLLLIGDGPLKKMIEEKAAETGIADSVIFLGIVDNVWDYMQAMDVFLLPSLYEGLPVVCVEAQAADLPCLVSNCVTAETRLSEHIHFIDNDRTGEWVEWIAREKNHNRQSGVDIKNFDIEKEGRKLEERYLYLWKKYKS